VAAIYVLASTLTPPVFLIVSVGAEGFADIFSPEHWRSQFSGRASDLFSIYVVYTGALAMVLLLGLPLVLLAFSASVKLGVALGIVTFCLLFGISLNLLGRLCGFFACGDVGLGELSGAVRRPASPASGPSPALPRAPSPVVSGAQTAASSRPEPVPVPPSPPGSGAPQQAPAAPAGATGTPQPAGSPVRPTALLDAQPRVDAARAQFERDPARAIEELEALRRDYLPHALVLHALALCYYRNGAVDRAVETAVEAIPMCIDRGQLCFAAELFKTMRAHVDRLRLETETLLTIAGSLTRSSDWAAAAKAYSVVIGSDAGDVRAIKGLLQVAEGILEHGAKPEAAAKIYRFLDKHCGASPLAEFIRQGLAESERRLTATS
jgi:hypothetical protein